MPISEKKKVMEKIAKLPPEIQRRLIDQMDGAQLMADYMAQKGEHHAESKKA